MEHELHMRLTRIEKKLDLLCELEGYEINEYGLPTPSEERLEFEKKQEQEENEGEEEVETDEPEFKTGSKIKKKVEEE